MKSDEEGVSTIDSYIKEQSKSGNINDSDPEKREDRVHIYCPGAGDGQYQPGVEESTILYTS